MIAVIGAGYAGLTAALELRRTGYSVHVLERLHAPGGRAQRSHSAVGGCVHDSGPSWYWMPSIFDAILARYGTRTDAHFNLTRLEPAYRLHLPQGDLNVPGAEDGFIAFARGLDPSFDSNSFLRDGEALYRLGMHGAVWDAPSSWPPFKSWMLRGSPSLLLTPLSAYLSKFTVHPTLTAVLSWPSQFLGMDSRDTPSLYAVLTHSGHTHGTWMPHPHGMAAPARALYETAVAAGVQFRFNSSVRSMSESGRRRVTSLTMEDGSTLQVDGVVAAADMAHVELKLMPPSLRRHSASWWEKQVMTPNVTIFMLCINRTLDLNCTHHMYLENPPFYASITAGDAARGTTSLYLLMPALNLTSPLHTLPVPMRPRPELLQHALRRLGIHPSEVLCGGEGYGPDDYATDFNAWKGNAFGAANMLSQTMWLKPSMDSLAENVQFAGHLTHPGPGVPPAMISGIVAAKRLHDALTPVDLTHAWVLLLCITAVTLLAHTRAVTHTLALHAGGRTYFAAASAMPMHTFHRIARLYSIFRAADDAVDCTHVSLTQRVAALDAVEADVYALDSGEVKLGHPRERWQRFFAAMRADTRPGRLVCDTTASLVAYMDGSAAVLGEFMMTELGADAALLHNARALGYAFQLTNMLRDVIEDAELGRQYIPADVCARHGISDLAHVALHDPQSPHFQALMEDMFAMADAWYEQADEGIARLPEDVRAPIALARRVYHRLHDAIRASGYVLLPRVRVSWSRKLLDACALLPASRVWRMPIAEATLSLLSMVHTWGASAVALLGTWLATQVVDVDGEVSYATFHALWTLPFLAGLALLAAARAHGARTLHALFQWSTVLCCVAVVYTTPWDAYLIQRGVWASTAVAGTALGIPAEEYAFFVLATVITCAAWAVMWPRARWNDATPSTPLLIAGIVALLSMAAFGAACVVWSDRTLYLGLLLLWASPVLLLQWCVGAPILLAHAGTLTRVIALSGGCMAIMDVWAIHRNIWVLNPEFSLWHIARGVHVEEVAFFLLSSAMCAGGLTLAMWASHGYSPHLLAGALQRYVEQAPRVAPASSAASDSPASSLDVLKRVTREAARAERVLTRRRRASAAGPPS